MRKQHSNTKRQRQLRAKEADYQFHERNMGLGRRKRALRWMKKYGKTDLTDKEGGSVDQKAAIA